MTPQQFVGVAVRLFAIWLWITAFQAFGVGRALAAQDENAFPVAYILVGIYVLAGFLLWHFPMWVSHKLIPRTKFEDKLRFPARDAVMVGCVILGLWVIVVRAIPSISWYVALAAFWTGQNQPLSTMETSRHLELVEGIVNLIIGWLLLTKFETITKYILRDRTNDAGG